MKKIFFVTVVFVGLLCSQEAISQIRDMPSDYEHNYTQGQINYFIKTYADTLGKIRPYKVYTALLAQSGTNAPVATVLENTLGGTVIWSRLDVGVYAATLPAAFPENKTCFFFTGINTNSPNEIWDITRLNDDTIFLTTYQYVVDENLSLDGLIYNRTLEIRVYP